MLSIIFPNINPIALNVGPIAIKWYSLAYIAGILAGFMIVKRLNRKMIPEVFSEERFDNIILWIVLGIIIGGRLGYVVFYGFEQFYHNPLNILKTWEGGMSFHGGAIGLVLSVYWFCLRQQIKFLSTMDLVACVAPIGIFFGRIANFINGELFGRVTDVPWGVVFPYTDGLARHPSQIYEALTEGLLLFVVMMGLFWRSHMKQKPGALSGMFLLLYSLVRVVMENYRQPDPQLGFIIYHITMGQMLSIPFMLLGIYLLLNSYKQRLPSK